MNLAAAGSRVIVRESLPPERSAGGVFLAPTARVERNRGIVLSVGPKVKSAIAVGDEVFYTAHDGDIIEDRLGSAAAGESVVVLHENEILAVVEP